MIRETIKRIKEQKKKYLSCTKLLFSDIHLILIFTYELSDKYIYIYISFF